jgi:ATP-dependent Clp protease ATP-binding subunit ClpA
MGVDQAGRVISSYGHGVFDRFSDRARSAVELAELETRRLGHHRIGTEHLLLGILSEGDSDQAQALKAAGATLDGARGKVAEAVGMNLDRYEGDPVYTARAKRAIERASRFSLQRLDEQVETEHLLLGILDVEGTACQVLRGLGVDVAGLRRTVDIEATASDTDAGAALGLSPRCADCGEVLATVLSHRELTATDEAGTRRDFVIAFCSACGSAVGASLA